MKITIDSSILENEKLKPVHINLYLHMIRLSHYGKARVSMSEIMREVRNNNRHRLIGYLRDLADEGYLEIDSQSGTVNTYTLNENFYSKEL